MAIWDEALKIGLPAVVAFGLGRLSHRLDRRAERREAVKSAAPAFELQPLTGSGYRLVNTGTATATRVRFDPESTPVRIIVGAPEDITLPPDHGHDFVIAEDVVTQAPPQLMVRCAELAGPVPVLVPAL